MEIRYGGLLTQKDLAYVFRQAMHLRLMYVVFWIITVAGLGYTLFFVQRDLSSNVFVPVFLALAFFVGLFWFFNPSLVAQQVLNQNPEFRKPTSRVIRETGISIRTLQEGPEVPWNVYQSALFCPDLVLLYQSKSTWNFYLRQHFDSEADWQAFLDLVNRKVTGKKETVSTRWPSISANWAKGILYGSLAVAIVGLGIFNYVTSLPR